MKTANDIIQKEQERNKWHYDHKIWCAKLMIGDTVLLWCTAYKDNHKIQDQRENTIYKIIEQPLKKMPVFKIKPGGLMTEWK